MGSLLCCCRNCFGKQSEKKNEKIPLLPISDHLVKMRWFHGRVSDKEAETRLRQVIQDNTSSACGSDGAATDESNGLFIVYCNPSAKPGYYTLLVYDYGVFIRMSIQPSIRDTYILLGKDGSGQQPGDYGYRTVEELIKTAQTNPIKLPNGKKIILRKPGLTRGIESIREINVNELNDKLWYHGDITNEEAKHRLCEGGKGINGSYLVYAHPQEFGNYILLVYHEGQILRWKITETIATGDSESSNVIKYVLGEDTPTAIKYKSVKDLVKAHRGVLGRPIKMDDGRLVTLSKSYVCLEK